MRMMAPYENANFLINHVGYAVNSIVDAANVFKRLGFIEQTDILCDQEQHVNVQLFTSPTTKICIELLEPSGNTSPIHTILRKCGPMPYHVCYEIISHNTEKLLETIKLLKLKKLIKRTYSPVFKKYVEFYYSSHIGIIEIMINM